MLNNINLKLISAMEDNGRIPYAQLARSLGISVSTATKKVESLLKNGVITIKAVPNPFKIGYAANAIIGMNVPVDKMDSVCKRLNKILNVNMIVTTFGSFNVLIAVYFTTLEKLYNFISTEILGRDDVSGFEIFFIKEFRKRYREISYDRSSETEFVKIDEIDEKIIEQLTENGRYSCAYIAYKLGISISSVSKRLYRLFKEDIIHIHARTNPIELGYQANAFIFIKSDSAQVEDICDRLKNYKEVIVIANLLNSYNIYINMVARNSEYLYEFIKKEMIPACGISDINILTRGEIIKRYYGMAHINKMLIHSFPPKAEKYF